MPALVFSYIPVFTGEKRFSYTLTGYKKGTKKSKVDRSGLEGMAAVYSFNRSVSMKQLFHTSLPGNSR